MFKQIISGGGELPPWHNVSVTPLSFDFPTLVDARVLVVLLVVLVFLLVVFIKTNQKK